MRGLARTTPRRAIGHSPASSANQDNDPATYKRSIRSQQQQTSFENYPTDTQPPLSHQRELVDLK